MEKFLPNSNFAGTNLARQDFSNSSLEYSDLRLANLRGANFSHANLQGVDLREANLIGANLSYTNLTNADLSGSIAIGANFNGATLCDADLSGVNLIGADLRGAYLENCFFYGNDLQYALINYQIKTWVIKRVAKMVLNDRSLIIDGEELANLIIKVAPNGREMEEKYTLYTAVLLLTGEETFFCTFNKTLDQIYSFLATKI